MFAGRGNATAFFIDTKTRKLKPGALDNLRIAIKAALLLGNVGLQCIILQDPYPGCSTRRRYCLLMGGGFVRNQSVCLCEFSCQVLRVLCQMLFLWQRSISWKEVLLEAGGVIPLSLASFAFGTRWNQSPFSLSDYFGVLVYVIGTVLNVQPEWARHRWKSQPENAGKLYMAGLFVWSRHVNYLGEILSFVGYAIASQWWTLWVPLVMGAGMVAFSIFELEYYLKKKYASEWDKYITTCPYKLIPYVF